MSPVEEFLKFAWNEVGYRESPTNITKYNEWADSVGYWFTTVQGCAWCTTFVAYCLEKSLPVSKYNWELEDFCLDDNCCWSDKWMNNFRIAGRFYKDPQPGDLAFKKGHVAIVKERDGKNIISCIEGNYEDEVSQVNRLIDEFIGFGRPKWENVSQLIQPITDSEEQQAMMWTINQGIIIGREDGDMHWKDNLTREEMAIVLYRYWKKFSNDR